jgi:hypothetical protein
MSSSDRWGPTVAAKLRERRLRATRNRFLLAALAATFLLGPGCAAFRPKKRVFEAREAVSALETKAAEVRTVRGRAWVKAKSPQGKISFAAIVAMDRSDPDRPELRIQAVDPIGATHALLLMRLEEGGQKRLVLTWIDYDERRVSKVTTDWYGIPLSALPELLVGAPRPPKDGVVGSVEADAFEIRSGANTYRYQMEWIDPGPRLALSSVEATLKGPRGRPERYAVHYSKFMDKDDLYLPQDVDVTGSTGAGKTDVDIGLNWRERRWNETIPPEVFQIPRLEGFSAQ